MTNNKDYIELREDFFENDVIKSIDEEYGILYTMIYVDLLLLSPDGYLKFNGSKKDFIKKVSLKINEKVEDIEKTIEILILKDLIDVISENEYFLKQTEVVRY
ncbi:hypothetical protein J2S72_001331 [Peptoniphilus koenoeneniae]|uniref:Phage replisome organiser N-terminal domain-containing protein n=1 Tax=Peptoniphilus koenoeneniae TaxID=507751 RepID=A0ABU0AVL2_9FIRM|nr:MULTISPECIES: phage replisome organizer N-terminal domain-containing protein [Peptoniphilus]ERT56219.1 phage replisome organizer, N-terminal domain protein [Peptoniphilus sp. BV3C26]MDQ0275306.1 hypothetical protein [Peptoniphilus koenoeneniae]